MNLSRRSSRPGSDEPPPGTRERRTVCRYSVVVDKAWIGWWQVQAFQSTPARIVDISLRGALLTVDGFPPKDQPVWFCPPAVTAQEDWIEVKVIGMRKRLFGPREMRISFHKVFPYEVFKTVVYGPDLIRPNEVPAWVPEESDERDWW